MTMAENQGQDPDKAGAVRGALLIVVVGAALGLGYNALGLAERPRHGLAWIKQPEKLESLEALQGTAPGPGGTATGAPESAGIGMPGEAQAATVSTSTPAAPAAASGSKSDSTTSAGKNKHADSTAAAPHSSATAKKGSKSSTSKTGTTAAKSGTASSAAHASATAPKPAAPASAPSSAAAPAQAAAPPPPTGAAPAGAAATAASAPADVPVIPDVTGPLKLELATLKKLYAASAAFIIDAREAEEYNDGHIAGAMSLPYNDAMADPDKVKKLDPAGKPFVVYCSGGECELSMNLAKLMVENGKRKVLVYEGGFPEWQGAGLPVTKGAKP